MRDDIAIMAATPMTNTDTQAGSVDTASATIDDIVEMASAAAFGRRLIQNNLRSIVVEAIVAKALGPAWRWCSADWAPYDFEGPGGLRLEVKQSAAQQTWSTSTSKPSKPVYDIAARNEFVGEQADHRDPAQWCFYVGRGTRSAGYENDRDTMDPRAAGYENDRDSIDPRGCDAGKLRGA